VGAIIGTVGPITSSVKARALGMGGLGEEIFFFLCGKELFLPLPFCARRTTGHIVVIYHKFLKSPSFFTSTHP